MRPLDSTSFNRLIAEILTSFYTILAVIAFVVYGW